MAWEDMLEMLDENCFDHKRILEENRWLLKKFLVSNGLYIRLLRQSLMDDCSKGNTFQERFFYLSHDARNSISSAFIWADSEEGHSFWDRVNAKLAKYLQRYSC